MQKTRGADDVVPPPSPTPHPLLRLSGTHDPPDGPMVGFVIPEHDPSPAHMSPERDLDFGLSSLSAVGSVGGGWVNRRAEQVFDGTSIVGAYVRDGTIGQSVIGGGANRPSKVDHHTSFPIYRFDRDGRVELSRVTDILFAKNSDDDFVPPPSGSGKGTGKGKSRAAAVEGRVDSLESTADSGTRVRRKRRCKAFPEEAEVEHRIKHDNDDIDHDSDEDNPRAHAISAPAPVFSDNPPKEHEAQVQDTLFPEGRFDRQAVPQAILHPLYASRTERTELVP
ncbi:hypothetical protein EI94DRAFT_866634 [Lactarius quietus]|nr:hypothetical protein EI94DRAFT_866634 [Lactarius quietus]